MISKRKKWNSLVEKQISLVSEICRDCGKIAYLKVGMGMGINLSVEPIRPKDSYRYWYTVIWVLPIPIHIWRLLSIPLQIQAWKLMQLLTNILLISRQCNLTLAKVNILFLYLQVSELWFSFVTNSQSWSFQGDKQRWLSLFCSLQL